MVDTNKPNYHRRCMLYEEYMVHEFGIRQGDYLEWLKMMHPEDYQEEMKQ